MWNIRWIQHNLKKKKIYLLANSLKWSFFGDTPTISVNTTLEGKKIKMTVIVSQIQVFTS